VSLYDVSIIGTGPIGPTVAGRARAAGLSVAAVERELVGGECSSWACKAGWLKSIGAELIRGHGRLDDHRRVGVATPDSGTMALTARHAVVICTGSRPALPELAGRGPALVSDEGDCGDRLIYQGLPRRQWYHAAK